MKKKILVALLLMLLVGVTKVSALEVDDEFFGPIDVVEETRYYKTITVFGDEIMSMEQNNINSITTEITEEEFNELEGSDPNISSSVTLSTRKITSKIEKSGNYYKYTAITSWNVIPSTSERFYDTISIGFYPSVSRASTPQFEQYYCVSGGNCTTQNAGWYFYNSSTGVAATYSLPSGSLSTLKQTFYVYVKKTDASSTIISQKAVAGYAHAIVSTTYAQAKNYYVDIGGIHYNANASSFIANSVGVNWSGNW